MLIDRAQTGHAPDFLPAGTVPPFRERPPWFGGDLQTLRNVVRGGPPDLPGSERLSLPVPEGDRLAARFDRPAGLSPSRWSCWCMASPVPRRAGMRCLRRGILSAWAGRSCA